MLREKEEELAEVTGFKIKIVEQSGTALKSLLVKSNPWAGGKCGRFNCLPCEAGLQDSKCFTRNILYENTCIECSLKGDEAIYIGESSMSAYERAGDHMGDYKSMEKDSHMFKYAVEVHEGRLNLKWRFKVIRTFQKSLTRQLSEAVRIKLKGEDRVLNDKGVYNRCAVQEIAVVQNQKIWSDEKKKFTKEHTEPETNDDTTTLSNKVETAKKRKQEELQPLKWGEHGETESENKAKRVFLSQTENTTAPPNQTSQKVLTDMQFKILTGTEQAARTINEELVNTAATTGEVNKELAKDMEVFTDEWEQYKARKDARTKEGKKCIATLTNKDSMVNMDVKMKEVELVVRGTKRKAFVQLNKQNSNILYKEEAIKESNKILDIVLNKTIAITSERKDNMNN